MVATRPSSGALEIQGFLATVAVGVGEGNAARLLDAVAAADAAALHAISEQCAPFFCPECPASYCVEHWNPSHLLSSDVTHGWCPRNHHRLVDD